MTHAIRETAEERKVWELLTRDFYWNVPENYPVQVYSPSGKFTGSARLQIFEIAMTRVLAHVRPDFIWQVTPNARDDGTDFTGVHRFLSDSNLGIDAAITVGGQCKKRTTVKEVLDEIAGSLIRMAEAVNPTFFVVALSAHVSQKRIATARKKFENQFHRDCHILDRSQIEGLLGDHLDAIADILQEGLTDAELADVLRYLERRRQVPRDSAVTVRVPPRVLAGLPFRIRVDVRSTLVSNDAARLWWRPRPGEAVDPESQGDPVLVVGPVGIDSPAGVRLSSRSSADDPLSATCTLEVMTYAVGRIDVGELVIGLGTEGPDQGQLVSLGEVDIVQTMRPRFFERPFQPGLASLSEAYEQARSGTVTLTGVVGAGGSGKSRMCEEFALRKRGAGCSVVTAKQPKTHDAPHRLVAEVLAGLVTHEGSADAPVDKVLHALTIYDRDLAARADAGIRTIFGSSGGEAGEPAEQHLVSALLVLIVARSQTAPLILHLQDLHWCDADVLLFLERVVAQLSQVLTDHAESDRPPSHGVLLILEGRVRESGDLRDDAWSSGPFEAFLRRADCPVVKCGALTPEDGHAFVRLLFERQGNAHQMVLDDLLPLQRELADRINESAGSNPFHSLEHVRLLKELGVLGQNPHTGLLYMIRPEPVESVLPDSVFESVRLRWQYLRSHTPGLALLLWASALLEDQVAMPLFRRLWRDLAPDVSLREIDGTDMLWTGDGKAHDVTFRHENYFESIRLFTVSETDRRRVIDSYCRWFAELPQLGPADAFRWARAILELPEGDVSQVKDLLSAALRDAREGGDVRLARRILAFRLDLTWRLDEMSAVSSPDFLRACDDEIDLSRELLGLDRDQARERLTRLRNRIAARLQNSRADGIADELRRLELTAGAVYAELLFNDRRPAQAAEIAERVVAQIRDYRPVSGPTRDAWEALEMEALYTHSCAQAISGEFGPSVRTAAAAARLAARSPSPLSRKVISTYGSLLLSEDPVAGEDVLRQCARTWTAKDSIDAYMVDVHLSMALILQARRCADGGRRRELLGEAADLTSRVFDSCRRLGLFAAAGAGALVRGVASALAGEGDEISWFAQGIAAGAKGRQMEVLWRSHINLAAALYQREGHVTPAARDHALAAVRIVDDTLAPYAEPDRSPRFQLVRVGLAAAASLLLSAGDEAGAALLTRYPRLRSHFRDPEAGLLAEYDGSDRHYQWLRVGSVDYILF